MSLLKSIKGFFSTNSNAANIEEAADFSKTPKLNLNRNALQRFFNKCDIHNQDVIDKLCDYIETGNEEILLKISPKAAHWNFTPFEKHHLFHTAFNDQSYVLGCFRLGKMIEHLQPNDYNLSHLYGDQASPVWWRASFTYALLESKNKDEQAGNHPHKNYKMTINDLHQLANLGGATITDILDIFVNDLFGDGITNEVKKIENINQWFIDNKLAITSLAKQLNDEQLSQFFTILSCLNLGNDYIDLLIATTMHGAKTARKKALMALITADKDLIEKKLTDVYDEQTPANRILLVIAAIALFNNDAANLLNHWLSVETSAKPKEFIEQQLAFLNTKTSNSEVITQDSCLSYTALDGSVITAPPHNVDDEIQQSQIAFIEDIYYQNFLQAIENYNAYLNNAQILRDQALRGQNDSGFYPYLEDKLNAQAAITQLKNTMNGKIEKAEDLIYAMKLLEKTGFDNTGISNFINNPALTLYQLLALLKVVADDPYFYLVCNLQSSNPLCAALTRKVEEIGDWRIMERIWTQKLNQPSFIEQFLSDGENKKLHYKFFTYCYEKLGENAFSYLIIDNIKTFDEVFGLSPVQAQYNYDINNAFFLLKLLHMPPKRYATAIMLLATGNKIMNIGVVTKNIKMQARRLLNNMQELDPAIAKLLQNGQQNVRASAAAWLASRNAKKEIPTLQTALKIEKSEVARAAYLCALKQLGDDVSNFLAPKILLLDAKRGLAKTKIKSLDWFPLEQIPQAHWKNGNVVDPIILQWWVTLAAKLKQPKGNAMMTLWLDQLKPEDANQFGLFVAQAWFAYDTPTYGLDDAQAYAARLVDLSHTNPQSFASQYPQYDYLLSLHDDEMLFESIVKMEKGGYKNNGADTKGILALTTKVKAAHIATLGANYLKKHSKRAAQAKAILDMLAANATPIALQIILAASNRIKQRSVRDYAKLALEEIADKNDCSLEDLMERTIPTAGLDENGEAELECGNGRVFKLKLNQSGALILLNDEGKEVKSLPNAKGDNKDDKDLITEAKKFIIDAKKELKQVFTFQTARLFEDMCFERLWSTADWQAYIYDHPIMRNIVSKLIWIGIDHDKNQISFRPLEDGSFTDSSDNAISLNNIEHIKLAHITLLEDAQAKAWRQHLADYEVKPSFLQLRDDRPIFTDEMTTLNQINDRKGFMIDSFNLRTIANKYGYERSEQEEAGWFTSYQKPYRSGNLVAKIHFTGNSLPETNRVTAITSLSFLHDAGIGFYGIYPIAIRDVPPVLLAEALADYHAIAASGTGFDPDWQKKTSF